MFFASESAFREFKDICTVFASIVDTLQTSLGGVDLYGVVSGSDG